MSKGFKKMGKGKGNKGYGGVPEGWLGCPSMGTGFIDDRFFVFKTPLKPELNGKVPQAERMSIKTVLDEVRSKNNSRIGLWIDLTNTSRYYDAQDVEKYGIIYQKFACEGHGRAPSSKAIYDFCGMVDRFFRRNHRDYIGIHCTHGFNRTGFLICCYLIRFRNYSAEDAVKEFAKHRQPGIYRQIYVDALYNMTQPIKSPLQVTQPYWLIQQQNSNNATFMNEIEQPVPSTSIGGSAHNYQTPKNTQASEQEHYHSGASGNEAIGQSTNPLNTYNS